MAAGIYTVPCRCYPVGESGCVGAVTPRDAKRSRPAMRCWVDGDTATAQGWTVQRWLRYWLTTRRRIRPTTMRSYQIHVENHLIPHLCRVRLSELTGRHITDMISVIGATTNRNGRTPSPSTLHRIRATLRSALNAAIREGLLRDNPARHVEVPSPRRPHALVWTPQRVQAWQIVTSETPSPLPSRYNPDGLTRAAPRRRVYHHWMPPGARTSADPPAREPARCHAPQRAVRG
jgi:hypothetical protein